MNEEKYIEEKVGRRNPFVVPEGYFDTFAVSQQPLQAEAVKVSTDVAFDEAADYVMLDNSDIYACLSDE